MARLFYEAFTNVRDTHVTQAGYTFLTLLVLTVRLIVKSERKHDKTTCLVINSIYKYCLVIFQFVVVVAVCKFKAEFGNSNTITI